MLANKENSVITRVTRVTMTTGDTQEEIEKTGADPGAEDHIAGAAQGVQGSLRTDTEVITAKEPSK